MQRGYKSCRLTVRLIIPADVYQFMASKFDKVVVGGEVDHPSLTLQICFSL